MLAIYLLLRTKFNFKYFKLSRKTTPPPPLPPTFLCDRRSTFVSGFYQAQSVNGSLVGPIFVTNPSLAGKVSTISSIFHWPGWLGSIIVMTSSRTIIRPRNNRKKMPTFPAERVRPWSPLIRTMVDVHRLFNGAECDTWPEIMACYYYHYVVQLWFSRRCVT